MAPILKPVAGNIGMNGVQFYIMMIAAPGVGFTSAPLRLNLFDVSGTAGELILKITTRATPFVFFTLIAALIIAHIPAISTTLMPDIYT